MTTYRPRVPLTIIDSEGMRHYVFLNQRAAEIVTRFGALEQSSFVMKNVVTLSMILGGPDTFCDALRWLASDNRFGNPSTAVEVSMWYWIYQNWANVD